MIIGLGSDLIDIRRIEKTLEPVRERGPRGGATPEERQLLCELSADLKGKYASSMMGAAASLVARSVVSCARRASRGRASTTNVP